VTVQQEDPASVFADVAKTLEREAKPVVEQLKRREGWRFASRRSPHPEPGLPLRRGPGLFRSFVGRARRAGCQGGTSGSAGRFCTGCVGAARCQEKQKPSESVPAARW